MEKGAGMAHKWTAVAKKVDQPTITISDARGDFETCEDAMEARAVMWSNFWKAGQDRVPDLRRKMEAVRELAVDARDALPELNLDMLDQGLMRQRGNRGLGSDQWWPAAWKKLPRPAKLELVEQLKLTELKLVYPLQVYLNFVRLIGKPGQAGGERPITVTALFYSTHSKMRSQLVRDFDEEKHGFWDDAIKGSSSLQAALRRQLMAEIGHTEGLSTADIFYDMEKFYDSLDPGKLIDAALALDYNAFLLYMGLQVHLAPRILIVGEAYSEVINVTSSIAAGCTQSNSWARQYLFSLLEDVHFRIPGKILQVRQYVDDLALRGQHQRQRAFFTLGAAMRNRQRPRPEGRGECVAENARSSSCGCCSSA